jgi:acetyl-CoA C-acetyltransferase
MGIGPAPATRAVLKAARLERSAVDRYEINEAFAAQYLAVEKELELDRARVNVHGGAIAIGHPLAASGLRLTTTVARELALSGGEFGISTACAGGGQGIAILLRRAA